MNVPSSLSKTNLQCAGPSSEYLGFFHLYKLFVRYCYPVQNKTDLFKNELMPKPNDFSDLPEYFVRKVRYNSRLKLTRLLTERYFRLWSPPCHRYALRLGRLYPSSADS